MSFAGVPELLEIIESPGLGQHQVNDDIIEIHQYPSALALAFNAKRLGPCTLGHQDNFLGHGFNVPAGIAGRDNKIICQRAESGNINVMDVDGFKVFKCGYNELLQLVGREIVTGVLLVQI